MWILRLRDWVGSGYALPKMASFIPEHALFPASWPLKEQKLCVAKYGDCYRCNAQPVFTGVSGNPFRPSMRGYHKVHCRYGVNIVHDPTIRQYASCWHAPSNTVPEGYFSSSSLLRDVFGVLAAEATANSGWTGISRDDAGSLSSLVSSADSCSIVCVGSTECCNIDQNRI